MNRILGLDVVRSIAILLVVWAHGTYIFTPEVSAALQAFVPSYAGVSIFFVLSGYLIGGILLRSVEKEFSVRDLGQFWIRRWFRTLPNYFLVLIFLVAYDIFIYKTDTLFSYRYLFFTQNLASPNPDFFPEAWSLSVEEWFYLLFPFLCYLGFKLIPDKKKIILILACFFIIVPALLRLYVYLNESLQDQWVIHHIVIFRLDGLMYGILGAYIHRYNPELWKKMQYPGLVIAALLLIFMSVINYFFREDLPYWLVYYYSLQALMTLVALPYFSSLKTIKNKRLTTAFTFISTISYAMYVLNLSVIQWRLVPAFMSVSHLNKVAGIYSSLVGFVIFWVATIAGSYLLYRYFEHPMTNLRDRIVIGRSAEKERSAI